VSAVGGVPVRLRAATVAAVRRALELRRTAYKACAADGGAAARAHDEQARHAFNLVLEDLASVIGGVPAAPPRPFSVADLEEIANADAGTPVAAARRAWLEANPMPCGEACDRDFEAAFCAACAPYLDWLARRDAAGVAP